MIYYVFFLFSYHQFLQKLLLLLLLLLLLSFHLLNIFYKPISIIFMFQDVS